MSWIPIHGQVMKKMTREDYIDAYKNMAIAEMHRSGVPASITLSQGMLESDNGNSRLARKGNNHFGIKCHNGWKGGKIYHDDDERKECFRKYDSVYESYEDHSDFLRGSTRYAFLFELNPADYEGWAKGLKKAGYATNPSYSSLLVKIIEENQLHQYDLTGDLPSWRSEKAKKSEISFNDQAQEGRIMQRNRIKYIVVQENETYESLRKEFSLMSFEIFKYNDLTPDSLLYEGRELYLQPKRNRAAAGKEYHILKIGETKCEKFEIHRTEVISKLYCPDSIAQISASFVPTGKSKDLDSEIVKLELVAECLDGTIYTDDCKDSFLDITLGFHLIVKCELIVQLLIPAYGYCPVPTQCEEDPDEDPCDRFDREPVPKFFPDQNLEPLFDDDSEYCEYVEYDN